jgi:hypothetical protein
MAYFNLPGNIPIFKIAVQIYITGDIMYGALNFSIQVEISSYSPVFFYLKYETAIFLKTSVVSTQASSAKSA